MIICLLSLFMGGMVSLPMTYLVSGLVLQAVAGFLNSISCFVRRRVRTYICTFIAVRTFVRPASKACGCAWRSSYFARSYRTHGLQFRFIHCCCYCCVSSCCVAGSGTNLLPFITAGVTVDGGCIAYCFYLAHPSAAVSP